MKIYPCLSTSLTTTSRLRLSRVSVLCSNSTLEQNLFCCRLATSVRTSAFLSDLQMQAFPMKYQPYSSESLSRNLVPTSRSSNPGPCRVWEYLIETENAQDRLNISFSVASGRDQGSIDGPLAFSPFEENFTLRLLLTISEPLDTRLWRPRHRSQSFRLFLDKTDFPNSLGLPLAELFQRPVNMACHSISADDAIYGEDALTVIRPGSEYYLKVTDRFCTTFSSLRIVEIQVQN
jgi:hypothetical protein